jgi:hypothetical protein
MFSGPPQADTSSRMVEEKFNEKENPTKGLPLA